MIKAEDLRIGDIVRYGMDIVLIMAVHYNGTVCFADGKDQICVRHIPSRITADIIPNMQSLPQSAKDIIMARKEPHIDYTNQMLIINPDGRADSWVPSSSDVFAEDWELVTE